MGRKDQWLAKAVRREAWAQAADAKAAAIEGAAPRGDLAFWTQPGLGKQRDKARARMQAAHVLRETASAHRAKAAQLRRMAGRNAGDAEAARAATRAALSAQVGDAVSSIYGIRRVLKVNAKTLRIEGPVTLDKALCRVVGRAA